MLSRGWADVCFEAIDNFDTDNVRVPALPAIDGAFRLLPGNTGRDRERYGDPDVGKAAYPRFLEKLSVCRDLFQSPLN